MQVKVDKIIKDIDASESGDLSFSYRESKR
jgi:hypothetical protein